MQDDIVCLFTAVNPAQAHMWQTALEEEGIESKVVGDYLEGAFGDIPGARAELWVHRADVDRASSVIENHPSRPPASEEA